MICLAKGRDSVDVAMLQNLIKKQVLNLYKVGRSSEFVV